MDTFLRPGILSGVKRVSLLGHGNHMSGTTIRFIIYSSSRGFYMVWRRTFGQEAIHHSIHPNANVPALYWFLFNPLFITYKLTEAKFSKLVTSQT